MHPKDEDIYPLETKVRWRKNGKIAVIKRHTFVMDGNNFLHYLAEFEKQDGLYCLLHDEVDLVTDPDNQNIKI